MDEEPVALVRNDQMTERYAQQEQDHPGHRERNFQDGYGEIIAYSERDGSEGEAHQPPRASLNMVVMAELDDSHAQPPARFTR